MPTPSVHYAAADQPALAAPSLEALAVFDATPNQFVLVPGVVPHALVLRAWPYRRTFRAPGFGAEPARSTLRIVWLKPKRGTDVILACDPLSNTGSGVTNWISDIRDELVDQFGVPRASRWYDLNEKVPKLLAAHATEGVLVMPVTFPRGKASWGILQPLAQVASDLKVPLRTLKSLCLFGGLA